MSQCMAAFMLLAAYSCQSDDKPEATASGKPIEIEVSIGPSTRIAYSGNAAQFTDGDRITLLSVAQGGIPSLSAGSATRQSSYTLSGDVWSSSPVMTWGDDVSVFDFYGVYPALSATDDLNDMSLKANLNDNDFMLASQLGLKYSDGKVSLGFSHAMAKLVVKIVKTGNEVSNPEGLTVKVANAKTHYSVSLPDLSVTASGTTSELAMTKQEGTMTYTALLPPQDGVTTIVVNDGTNNYKWTSASPLTLAKSKVTTVSLSVGEGPMTIGTVSVTDWTDSPINPDYPEIEG